MNEQINKGEIVIYQTEDGQTSLEVNLVEDTVWLSLNHVVALFDRDKSVISRHIKNIFREGELDKKSVVAKYATTASDGKTYQVEYFNLDVIISVSYRVKSQRGTQFRIWANKILKDYIIKGYALNEKRLQSQIEKYEALKQSIKLIDNIIDRKLISTSESEGLLKVISDFSYALDTLDRYDYGKLELAHISERAVKRITYEEAKGAIKIMQGRLSDSTLKTSEKSGKELIEELKLKHKPTFRMNYLKPAIEAGLIELTIPEKPKSRFQKYRLTKKGYEILRIKTEKIG
jgi:transcriptional regulator CtsR